MKNTSYSMDSYLSVHIKIILVNDGKIYTFKKRLASAHCEALGLPFRVVSLILMMLIRVHQ